MYRRADGVDLSIADLDRMTYTQAALKVSFCQPFFFTCRLIDIFVGSGVDALASHYLDARESGESG